jgi:hypothetical protein
VRGAYIEMPSERLLEGPVSDFKSLSTSIHQLKLIPKWAGFSVEDER